MDYQLKRQEPAGLIHSVQSWAGLIFKWWVCEIGASIISIGGSITLLVVLKNADQGPQRPWIIGNTQLTLNTVVAIVSTVIRASLIVMISGALNQSSWNWFAKKQRTDHQQLDERPKRENWYTRNEKNREMEFGRPLDDLDTFGEAASSSLACLKLLCRTKYLASLGAALVILSLAFDAFSQQVLTIDTRNVWSTVSGSHPNAGSQLPRATSWADIWPPGANTLTLTHNPYPPLDASAAIMVGTVGPGAPPLTVPCSSGNCTWPTTPTLGLCGACDDVRNDVSSALAAWPTDGIVYTLPLGDTYLSLTNEEMSNISVNSGHSPSNTIFNLVSSAKGGVYNQNSNNSMPSRQEIAKFWVLGIPASFISDYTELYLKGAVNVSSKIDPLVIAHSCSLYFCLQAYNATTLNGVFSQEFIESWDKMDGTIPPNFVVGDQVPGAPQPVWRPVDVPSSMNVANASAYSVDWESRVLLASSLLGSIGGTVQFDAISEQPSYRGTQSDFSSTLDGAAVQAMWMAANSTSTMGSKVDSIANTFTTYMRTELTAPFESRYAPSVANFQVVVHVRWPWLAYPLCLVVAAHVFLVATIMQTERRAVRPWKARRLPLLLADVNDIICESAAGASHRCDGFEESVGRMRVQLDFDGGNGVSFKRVGRELPSQ